MATTRIMPLHVGKGRTESRAISDIIDYVENPKKSAEYMRAETPVFMDVQKLKIGFHTKVCLETV